MIFLQYHSFNDNPDRYHITPQAFKSQIKEISEKKDFIVTIDDGVPSVYSIAFPILQKFNVPAIIFIDTLEIGKSRMTADQIREMFDAGFSIQSHSHTHRNHYYLTDEEIKEEGRISKDILEQITSDKVVHYAFPHGAFSEKMCDILLGVGYRDFYTSDFGIKRKEKEYYKIYNRIEIFGEKKIDYYLNPIVVLKRRLRIEYSKLRMKLFPNR